MSTSSPGLRSMPLRHEIVALRGIAKNSYFAWRSADETPPPFLADCVGHGPCRVALFLVGISSHDTPVVSQVFQRPAWGVGPTVPLLR